MSGIITSSNSRSGLKAAASAPVLAHLDGKATHGFQGNLRHRLNIRFIFHVEYALQV